jgi:hypothetical protein
MYSRNVNLCRMLVSVALLCLVLTGCGQAAPGAEMDPNAGGATTGASPDAAVPEHTATPSSAEPGVVSTTAASPTTAKEDAARTSPPPVAGDLLSRAQQNGSVRIIVGLNVPFVPEGELPDAAAVDAQHKAIADAQAALVQRLSGFTVSDVEIYESIPFVAMVVDAAALQVLLSDPAVTSIEEDGISGPSAAPGSIAVPQADSPGTSKAP